MWELSHSKLVSSFLANAFYAVVAGQLQEPATGGAVCSTCSSINQELHDVSHQELKNDPHWPGGPRV